MKKLHKHLSSKHRWYADWHAHPHTNKIHWGVLLVVLMFMFLGLKQNTAPVRAAVMTADAKTFAEDNNLHLLKEGEYAIIISSDGKKTSKKSGNGYFIKIGDVIKRVDGDNISVIEYKSGANTYVNKDDPSTNIYSIYEFDGYDESGKIDKAILRKLKNKNKVSVIVQMKSSSKYYDDKDTDVIRATKAQNFKSDKDSVEKSVGNAGKLTKELKIIYGFAMEVSEKALHGLKNNPKVKSVELDRERKLVLDKSVDEINAKYPWGMVDQVGNTITGKGTTIAILDTGVDYRHIDLGGCFGPTCKVIGGWDFVGNDSDPMDDEGHGTHVAATAAGNGLLKGVAPDAKILAYKVCDSGGWCNDSNTIAAIDRSTDPNQDGSPSDHVEVASMSLGGPGDPDDPISTAVDRATAAGVISTIAAGNSGPSPSTIGSPGAARTAITVAAACAPHANLSGHCSSGAPIASFSSRGPLVWKDVDIKKPDISAPGVMICAARWGTSYEEWQTCFDDSHVRLSGTSMATPHMAGVAALIKQANPSFTPVQVKDKIKSTARNLGLGMTYNDQGAGMVDVKNAVPAITTVKSTPEVWSITTNPTQKISTHTQSFTVKSTSSLVTSASIALGILPAGVTISTSKPALSFGSSGSTSDSYSVTVTVDNDIAKNGSYFPVIYYKQGADIKGGTVIPLNISSTITSNLVSLIDYGVDNPDLLTWTSKNVPIVFTNQRGDISQTFTLNPSTFPLGINYQVTPTTITLGPKATTTVNTSFTVNNSQTVNGKYYGSLKVVNSVNNLYIPIRFVKYYTFTFNPASSGDFRGDVSVYLYKTDGVAERVSITLKDSSSITLYANYPGPYDAEIHLAYPYHIIKENLMANSVTTVSKSEANRAIKVVPTNIYGDNLSGDFFGDQVSYFTNNSGYFSGVTTNAVNSTGDFYINGSMSSKYSLHRQYYPSLVTDDVVYLFGGEVKGGSTANFTFTNTPASLKKLTITPYLNNTSGKSFPGIIVFCPAEGGCGWNRPNLNLTKTYPFTRTAYYIPMEGSLFYSTHNHSDNSCSLPSECPNKFYTPYIDLLSGEQKYSSNTYFNSLPTKISDKIFPGLGPVGWFVRFNNSTNQIWASNPPNTPTAAIIRQGFETQQYNSIPYTIKQGGAVVATGDIPQYDIWLERKNADFLGNNVSGGAYTFSASFPYRIDGNLMNGMVESGFNTTMPDPNPPYMEQIGFFTNGVRNQTYDKNYPNKVEFGFNANGGSLTSVMLSYATDGTTFQDVPLTLSGSIYSATLPTLNMTTGKITLKVKATDSSNNYLQYSFEMPIAPVAVSVPDSIAPTVTITSPINGSFLGGTVFLTAEASDNVGVARVEYYKDSETNSFASSTRPPYDFSWDTTTVSNGTHILRAVAYDEAGNSGISAPVSIGIGNAVDSTPPSLSITSPKNMATLSGVATVSADATDNVGGSGMSRVEFYKDSDKTPFATDTTSPYSVSWDTRTVPNGTHTLTYMAIDMKGNGSGKSISVKVSNTGTSDTTSPTTSITSPISGNTVSGTATISADASDNVAVTKVEFYQGSTLLGTDISLAYSYSWDTTTVVNGTYSLTTKAYDAAGNTGTSDVVSVTVNNVTNPNLDTVSPVVSITSPASGAVLAKGSATTVSATASDNIAVAKIEIYQGNTLICTDTSLPYSCSWQVPNAPNKTYTLTAKAYDPSGNIGTSSSVTVKSGK